MIVADIINQARERLGDLKEQRWTNNRLISIISQGHIDICIETGFLRKVTYIPLAINRTMFDLPNDCFEIKRVEYAGTLLPLHSRNDKDIPRMPTTAFVAYKSNLNMDRLEVQPAVSEVSSDIRVVVGNKGNEAYQVTPLYGVITGPETANLIIEPIYGAVVDIISTSSDNDISDGYGEIGGEADVYVAPVFPNGNYGVVVSVDLQHDDSLLGFISGVKGHIVTGSYGLVANISRLKDTFKVYYTATPRKVRDLNAHLVLPELWEELLLKYVVGTALQDDNDASNLQRGEVELQKYVTKLQTLKDQSSLDFSASSSDKLETNFRRV